MFSSYGARQSVNIKTLLHENSMIRLRWVTLILDNFAYSVMLPNSLS